MRHYCIVFPIKVIQPFTRLLNGVLLKLSEIHAFFDFTKVKCHRFVLCYRTTIYMKRSKPLKVDYDTHDFYYISLFPDIASVSTSLFSNVGGPPSLCKRMFSIHQLLHINKIKNLRTVSLVFFKFSD